VIDDREIVSEDVTRKQPTRTPTMATILKLRHRLLPMLPEAFRPQIKGPLHRQPVLVASPIIPINRPRISITLTRPIIPKTMSTFHPHLQGCHRRPVHTSRHQEVRVIIPVQKTWSKSQIWAASNAAVLCKLCYRTETHHS
jgi:hypothetical protein